MSIEKTTGKIYLWGPCLLETQIDEEFCNELLERAKKTNIKHNSYLVGLIEKEYLYLDEDREWCFNKILPYIKQYLETGNLWYRNKLNNNVVNLKLTSLWINYMKNGEYNPDHIHGDDISFVIYLKIPKALQKEAEKQLEPTNTFYNNLHLPGSITFSYGENMVNFINKNYIFPKEKSLLIFPSNLRHAVVPFKSKCERISVSGNFKIIQNEQDKI